MKASPRIGGIKAAVRLKPVDQTDEKEIAQIQIARKYHIIYSEERKESEQQDYADLIEKSLSYYKQKVKDNKKVDQLNYLVQI